MLRGLAARVVLKQSNITVRITLIGGSTMSQVVKTGATSEDLTYYNKIRDTIHGLDGVIVKVINDSVTIVTGALTLSVVLYDKLDNSPWNSVVGLILVIITFGITYNSRERIKLYANLLAEAVAIAITIEPKLFADNESLTLRLDRIPDAGMKGQALYLKSAKFLIVIEAILAGFYFLKLILYLCNQLPA